MIRRMLLKTTAVLVLAGATAMPAMAADVTMNVAMDFSSLPIIFRHIGH